MRSSPAPCAHNTLRCAVRSCCSVHTRAYSTSSSFILLRAHPAAMVKPSLRSAGGLRPAGGSANGTGSRQGYEQLCVATGGAAVGFYQRCGWRICETVDRDFEPATVLTKGPRAEPRCSTRMREDLVARNVAKLVAVPGGNQGEVVPYRWKRRGLCC